MPAKEYEAPADAALAQFLERIKQDEVLPAAVREAVCEDVTAENSTSFEKLTAALAAGTKVK